MPKHNPCYPVLAFLSKCYPRSKGRLPTRYSPVRHFTVFEQARRGLVRLACVRHAASVHSEPGSNSPVELVWSIRRISLCKKETRFLALTYRDPKSSFVRCPIFKDRSRRRGRLDSMSALAFRAKRPGVSTPFAADCQVFFRERLFFSRSRQNPDLYPDFVRVSSAMRKKNSRTGESPGKSDARLEKPLSFPAKRNQRLYRFSFALSNAFFIFFKDLDSIILFFRSSPSGKKKAPTSLPGTLRENRLRVSAQTECGLYSFDSEVSTGFLQPNRNVN